MKLLVFVAFLASAASMISAKKLLVVGGLNGGVNPGVFGLNPGVFGLNPGVVGLNGGLMNPGMVVGGVNPLIGGGGAFLAQPPVAPMIPAIPPYFLQRQFGLPGAPAQLPQPFPFQPYGGMPFLPSLNRQVLPPQQLPVGMPFLPSLNRQVLPPQQLPVGMPFLPSLNCQVLPPQQLPVGQMNPGANGQQPQGDMPTGVVPRFRRALSPRWRKQESLAQVTPSAVPTEQPDV